MAIHVTGFRRPRSVLVKRIPVVVDEHRHAERTTTRPKDLTKVFEGSEFGEKYKYEKNACK